MPIFYIWLGGLIATTLLGIYEVKLLGINRLVELTGITLNVRAVLMLFILLMIWPAMILTLIVHSDDIREHRK